MRSNIILKVHYFYPFFHLFSICYFSDSRLYRGIYINSMITSISVGFNSTSIGLTPCNCDTLMHSTGWSFRKSFHLQPYDRYIRGHSK